MRRLSTCLALCCALTGVAQADDGTTVGITLNGTTGAHIEPQQMDAVPFLPLPTLEIDHTHKRLLVHLEILPPIGPVPLAQGGSIFPQYSQNPRISYIIGDVRYVAPSGNFSAGIGETVINQQTHYPPTPFIDSSRVVGFRFVADSIVYRGANGTLVASFSTSPAMHGLQDGRLSENASLIDTSLRWNHDAGPYVFGYGVRYVNYAAAYANGELADRNHLFMPFVAMDWKIGDHSAHRAHYHEPQSLGPLASPSSWHFGFTFLGTNGARSVYGTTTVSPMPFVLLPLVSLQRSGAHTILALEAIAPNNSTNLFGSLGQTWSYVNADAMARIDQGRIGVGLGETVVNLEDATPARYTNAQSRSEGLHAVVNAVIAQASRTQTQLRLSASPYLHIRTTAEYFFPPPFKPLSIVSYQHGARVDCSLQQTLSLPGVGIVYGLRYINQTTNYGRADLTRTYSLDPFVGIILPR